MTYEQTIIQRPGGEQWRRYELRDGFVVTTGGWRTLVAENPGVVG